MGLSTKSVVSATIYFLLDSTLDVWFLFAVLQPSCKLCQRRLCRPLAATPRFQKQLTHALILHSPIFTYYILSYFRIIHRAFLTAFASTQKANLRSMICSMRPKILLKQNCETRRERAKDLNKLLLTGPEPLLRQINSSAFAVDAL